MTPLINYVLLGCALLYGVFVLGEAFAGGTWRNTALEGVLLLLFVGILRFTTGFPMPAQTFGGVSPVPAIALMFACVVAGIAARYVFSRKGRYNWRSFVKPLVISPIVLLPLLGSLQGVTTLEPIQMISFALLSFQNGFFWKTVLERAKA